MRKLYGAPTTASEPSFETGALACGKTSPPPGSWHFYSAHDTFTGHFGGAMGWSFSGQVGLGRGPGGTRLSYSYQGLCINWVQLSTWSRPNGLELFVGKDLPAICHSGRASSVSAVPRS